MKVDIRHNPSLAVARVALAPGEQFRAESGAMMATSHGVSVAPEWRHRREGHHR
jgi:uncharacterized protein (AIM24 family)